jgi:hypothetical protein
MPLRNSTDQAGRARELRRRIALEAARLMSEHGIRDFHLAKLKAAERVGAGDDAGLPKNSEIEEALREHQRLFQSDEQPARLRRLREIARDAMRFFARFDPRLVGAVLEGTADRHSAVCLHLFCDAPEEIAGFLHERGIPYEEQNRRLRTSHDAQEEFPVLLFSADDAAIDITLLPHDAIRQAPLDRVDDRPMRRASLATLEKLLAGEPGWDQRAESAT